MKKFLSYSLFFLMLIAVSIFALLLRADGYTDAYYLRFTTPKQQNLIVGTSKAAQGLRPDVMNPILKTSLYNYAFDISKSPYGPKYLESIGRKLRPGTRNGLFIVTVDCWSISTKNLNPEDSTAFGENHSCVGEMKTVDQKPNFKYLTQYMSGKYYGLIFKSSIAFLHDDGWFEVTLDDDPASIVRRTKSTMDQYKQDQFKYKFSQLRLDYLIKTIDFLNQHGKVYLVRMPIAAELMEIEQSVLPDFNLKIKQAVEKSYGFLDLTHENDCYNYIDGAHLDKRSGRQVSERIANWISKQPMKLN